MNPFPVDFQALAQQGGNPANGGYPYSIKGSDLMRDFVAAALDTDDALVETVTGQGGHPQRRLNVDAGTAANQIYIWNGSKITAISAPPTSGTHVLGAVGGALQWIATEECA